MPPERRGPLFPDLRLTRQGVWTLLAGVGFLATGVLTSSWPLVLWGELLIATVALARVLVEPEARTLFAGGATARIRPGTTNATVGRPLTIGVVLDGPPGRCVIRVSASPDLGLAPTEADFDGAGERGLEAVPRRMGHAFIYGARRMRRPWPGLFELESWHPAETTVRVLPTAVLAGGRIGTVPRREVDQAASHLVRRAGLGSEFRELRDHRPGDPYRAIAWKPSARRRRLLVREFESEVRLTLTALVDISPSMRRGPLGETPLDRAVEVVARLTRPLLAAGDRVGLVTFDHRPVHRVLPAGGRTQLHALVRPLLELWHAVEEDLTAADRLDAAEAVADHIRYQHGLELRDPPDGEVDAARLEAVLRYELFRRRGQIERLGRRPGAFSADPDDDRVRLFCRLAGVHLDYRRGETPKDLERGLVAALELATRASRTPTVLVLLSDLIGQAGVRLHHALRLLRTRRNQLVVLAPHPASGTSRPEGLAGEVHHALVWADDPRARPAAQRLRAAGTPVMRLGGGDPLPELLARLARMRLGR